MAHPACAFFLTMAVVMMTGIEGSRHHGTLVYWVKPLCQMVDTIDKIEAIGTSLQRRGTNLKDLERFVRELRILPRKAERFLHANFDLPVKNSNCIQKLVNFTIYPYLMRVNKYAYSYVSYVSAQELSLVRNNIRSVLKTQLNSSKGASAHLRHITLPLRNVRPSWTIGKPLGTQITSILSICKNTNSCDRMAVHTAMNRGVSLTVWDAKTLCGPQDDCSDWKRTMPLMAAFFWHKLLYWFVLRMCPHNCLYAGCPVKSYYTDLLKEAQLFIAYVDILKDPWKSTLKSFFQTAVQKKAFLNLDVALNLVQKNERYLDTTILACFVLKATHTSACRYAEVYQAYVFIKQIKQYRSKSQIIRVKNLQFLSRVDHYKMLELQRHIMQYFQLIGNKRKFDINLKTSVSGISKFLQGLATYDEAIAEADRRYILDKLNKFEQECGKLFQKIDDDIRRSFVHMKQILKGNKTERSFKLAAAVATSANPLKVIFTGPEDADILELTAEVASLSPKDIKTKKLNSALIDLSRDTRALNNAFLKNKTKIWNTVEDMIHSMKKGSLVNDDDMLAADMFIQVYGHYKPEKELSKNRLKKNDALWSTFKDAVCDVLNRGTPFGFICENLEAHLAHFFTLRAEMFDFQSELLDVVATIARGNIGKRLSRSVSQGIDIVSAKQLMVAFFTMQNSFQRTASLYCDILEYRQYGRQTVDACSQRNVFFKTKDLDALINYKDISESAIIETEREVYIPTRAQFPGDTGFIDLQALSKGETISFRLPSETNWLLENRWLLEGEKAIPFVENFEIFLPLKNYKTRAQRKFTTTVIRIASIAGSLLSPQAEVVYILPREHSEYMNVYEEGYTSCPSEMENPYSLCKNLPKICDRSNRRERHSLLPTIFSTWTLSVSVQQGSRMLKWKPPSPTTRLLIRAKVRLRLNFEQVMPNKKRSVIQRAQRASPGCCGGNRYRISIYNNNCATCPINSTSIHQGLYCEND